MLSLGKYLKVTECGFCIFMVTLSANRDCRFQLHFRNSRKADIICSGPLKLALDADDVTLGSIANRQYPFFTMTAFH
jgi:hypothetical protein